MEKKKTGWARAAAVVRALCIGVVALTAALLTTAGAAQAQGHFTFRVCNDSSVPKIGIAVKYRVGTNPTRYRVLGWIHVDAKHCTDYGPLPKGPFWFHAEESGTPHPSVEWGNADNHFCVDREGKFAFEYGETHTCKGTEAKAFYADVQDNVYVWHASGGKPAANDEYTGCQKLCVGQYNACRGENGPNCLTLRQGCWDRCRASEQPKPAPSQASGGKFHFHVCNRSKWIASVAVSWKISSNPDKFEASGWKNIKPGECATMGPYPKGGFWYYAFGKSSNRQWAGDIKVCVDKNAGFTRVYERNYVKNCREDVVGFTFHHVDSDRYTWNLDN